MKETKKKREVSQHSSRRTFSKKELSPEDLRDGRSVKSGSKTAVSGKSIKKSSYGDNPLSYVD